MRKSWDDNAGCQPCADAFTSRALISGAAQRDAARRRIKRDRATARLTKSCAARTAQREAETGSGPKFRHGLFTFGSIRRGSTEKRAPLFLFIQFCKILTSR